MAGERVRNCYRKVGALGSAAATAHVTVNVPPLASLRSTAPLPC